MKILVFGAGAIGSVFGGFLSRSHEVTLLGRAWHLDAIRKKGLRVEGIWGRHRFRNFHLATDAQRLFRSIPPFDLILVTVKSYDTPHVTQFLKNRLRPATVVLSLQNGVGNIETLHRFLPPSQVMGGRVITGVEIGPGKVTVTVSADKIRMGESVRGRKPSQRARALARLFSACGLPADAVPDVEKYLWAKLVYNCALNALASLLGVHYGALAEGESTRALMEAVIREVYRVARAKRIPLEPGTAEKYIRLFYRKLVPSTYGHHPSMLQDLRRGKRTEIDALNGAVVRFGRALRIPTPFNELLTELIHSREAEGK